MLKLEKCTLTVLIMVAAVALGALSHGNIEDSRALVEQNASCSELSDEQLEQIGDYYMEIMHPGEAHEIMDNMHGSQGSEELRKLHIAIAQTTYCDKSGMDGSMMGDLKNGWSMMPGSMMRHMMMGRWSYDNTEGDNMLGGGKMMGSGAYGGMMGGYGGWWVWSTLSLILLIGLIILVYVWIWKLLKSKK